jgi:micrococcal nuclease
MFNARLLLEGYAQHVTFPPNVRYAGYFRIYQTEARQNQRGLWELASEEVAVGSAHPEISFESEYVGNKNSLVFHRPSCNGAATMKAKNRVILESRQKAIEEGFKPCPICKP